MYASRGLRRAGVVVWRTFCRNSHKGRWPSVILAVTACQVDCVLSRHRRATSVLLLGRVGAVITRAKVIV